MNTKNNSRVRKSREKIEQIFIDLLQDKNIDEISVTEICRLAGVNRTTFYNNYDDVYALADAIREKLRTQVQTIYHYEIENHFNSQNYIKLFRHIYENQTLYKTYFKLRYDRLYVIEAYDRKLAQEHFNNEHIEYHCEFFRAAINAIIRMWLDNGCRETPEEMVGIIQAEYKGR